MAVDTPTGLWDWHHLWIADLVFQTEGSRERKNLETGVSNKHFSYSFTSTIFLLNLYHYAYLLSQSALTAIPHFPQVPLITRSLILHTCSHQQVLGWSHSMITAVLAGSNHFFYQPWASTAFFQGHLLFTGSLCSALTCSSNISAFSFPQHWPDSHSQFLFG